MLEPHEVAAAQRGLGVQERQGLLALVLVRRPGEGELVHVLEPLAVGSVRFEGALGPARRRHVAGRKTVQSSEPDPFGRKKNADAFLAIGLGSIFAAFGVLSVRGGLAGRGFNE